MTTYFLSIAQKNSCTAVSSDQRARSRAKYASSTRRAGSVDASAKEIAAYLLVFLLVWQTKGKFKTPGFAFLTYLAGYGAARFAVEFFRGNPAILAWGIPAAQVFAVVLVLAAIAGFCILGEARARRRQF
ncbi:MAG TPA: prolipoprotein diacylglyceryl transferase family protein [Burkholderiales bacterium]|nr:prolipoprotein diacylglyceryl transferase family protein [Burkholderiales bacterium]